MLQKICRIRSRMRFAELTYSKFTWQLCDVCVQNKPLLIRVDTKSGHGAGKPTSKLVNVVLVQILKLVTYVDIKLQQNTETAWKLF